MENPEVGIQYSEYDSSVYGKSVSNGVFQILSLLDSDF